MLLFEFFSEVLSREQFRGANPFGVESVTLLYPPFPVICQVSPALDLSAAHACILHSPPHFPLLAAMTPLDGFPVQAAYAATLTLDFSHLARCATHLDLHAVLVSCIIFSHNRTLLLVCTGKITAKKEVHENTSCTSKGISEGPEPFSELLSSLLRHFG